MTKYIGLDSPYFPEIAFIVVGLQKEGRKIKRPRIFTLYSYSLFFPGEVRDYAIEGKTTISDYLFTKHYKQELSDDKKIELITRCLYDTENIDGEAGGKKTIAVLDKYGYKVLDINSILQEIENEELKDIITKD